MELDDVTGEVVTSAIGIHRELGPGLLESVYEVVLSEVLARRGLRVSRQCPVSFEYDGIFFENAFRIDLLVEDQVVLEIKSVERTERVHGKQLLTYLRLTGRPVGMLLNFGAPTMKDGLKRVVNDLAPSASPRLRVNKAPPR